MISRENVPFIHILYDAKESIFLEPYVKEIAYGIEEEGLLFEAISNEKEYISEAAYLSALSSPLGVAVGIVRDFIVLMDKHMKDKKPVLHYSELNFALCRRAGQNAARLVKCKPFLL